MVGVMVVMATSFKMTYASMPQLPGLLWSVPLTADPLLCQRLPDTPRHVCQSPVGPLLPSPGSWWTQGFVCALQESVPPVLWDVYNQIPLAFKIKFPGDSQSLCWIPRLENLLWALEILQQLGELLWYNCSPVCGLSTQLLYSGTNGNLLQEIMPHTMPPRSAEARAPVPVAGHCWPLPPQETLRGKSGSVSSGGHCSFPWVLVCTSFCLCLWVSLMDLRFDSKHDFASPAISLGLLLCP